MTMFVRLFWVEPRLQLKELSQLSMDPLLSDLIWKPDIYFSNEEDGYTHDQLGKNELMTLYKNGTIFYSRRYEIQTLVFILEHLLSIQIYKHAIVLYDTLRCSFEMFL